jgi:hypothetical protein
MSNNSYHDGNNVHTLIVVETDGQTLINIEGNPNTHVLDVSDGNTGSDNGPYVSRHDSNNVPVLIAVSSVNATVNGKVYKQGITPVVVYGDSNGNLLVDSN